MNEVLLFKGIVGITVLLFVWYGMDVRAKAGAQNFVAPSWQILMKASSFSLIGAFVWIAMIAREVNEIDWLALVAMASGTGFVIAAKRALGSAHTFTGQHLEKPRLVTKGVYSITRNPLYFGVFQCETGASLFVLKQAPVLFPQSYLAIFAVLTAALVYAIVFNLRMARKEASFLESYFGDDYRRWSATVGYIAPFFNLAKRG